MKIDVIITPEYIDREYIKGKNIVVIDMLRATTVMVTAIGNGCKEVIPFLTVEEVLEKAKEIGRENCILGGERNAEKIEGFDLSNSPLEYTKEVVEGKTILITTSNGTKALTKSLGAKRIFVGCVLNGKSVAEKLAKINEDIIILNSGTNGEFTMDDFICTGYIIDEISKITNKIELTDISKTAQYIYEQNKDLESFISKAKHYGRMKELDLMPDVEYAMKKGFTNLVPEYKDNHIIVE
ncbi:2-phosphosulfolactate phosphatase family protein [Clostridium thermobutyricum]|uniref:Probable 2-phosphosulfolactate phosphatase n=1 Tax=Clostridium thermobutyricum DSM 4928 TaxID=1121339 RepID=A0A1V4STB4_9CLOT|nr:2-phosphosulfolactate phosphatase family protein [Clostridium thermobutyricum]OPX47033.1 putative 2-phosphosulfolactate phosphatase [Clostridium thermobutyricum DSM 4928]